MAHTIPILTRHGNKTFGLTPVFHFPLYCAPLGSTGGDIVHIRPITMTQPALAQTGGGPLDFILNLFRLQQAIETLLALRLTLKSN